MIYCPENHLQTGDLTVQYECGAVECSKMQCICGCADRWPGGGPRAAVPVRRGARWPHDCVTAATLGQSSSTLQDTKNCT